MLELLDVMKRGAARGVFMSLLVASGCSTAPAVRHAREGRLPELQGALQAGTVKPKHRNRALCEAAARGHAEAALLLVRGGADIEGGEAGRLGKGCFGGCSKGLDLPRGVGSRHVVHPTPLGCAALYGHEKTVKALLTSGASPSLKSHHANHRGPGGSPLVLAVMGGHADVVRLLLDAGADPFFVPYSYTKPATAYARAVKLGHREVARLLVESAGLDALEQAEGGVDYGPMPGLRDLMRAASRVQGAANLMSAAQGAEGAMGKVQTAAEVVEAGQRLQEAAGKAEQLKVTVPASFADTKVAVLPLNNLTLDLRGPILLRKLLQMQLAAVGFRTEGLEWIDKKLKDLGITDGGQLPSQTPAAVARKTESEALLYGEVEEFQDKNIGVYASRTVGARLWLIDGKTGQKIWESSKKRTNPKVAVTSEGIKAGLAESYGRKLLEGALESPLRPEAEDVVRLLVKDLVDALEKR